MKHYRITLAIGVLLLASLACQAVIGGGSDDLNDVPLSSESVTEPEAERPDVEASTTAPADNDSNDNADPSVNSDLPMIDDAFNVVETGGNLTYFTDLSAEDALKFYRDEYTSMGYTEREMLTVVESGMFSIVFDGDPSGKAVVIQSVDLGDGSRTISIRLEDV